MEAVLVTISDYAPSVFYTLIVLIVVSKLFIQVSRILARNYLSKRDQLKNELELLRVQNKAYIDKLDELKHCSGTVTGDHSNCPVTGYKCQIEELELKLEELNKVSKKLDLSVNLFLHFVQSPVGQLLGFIGNSDSFITRRKA